MEDLTPVKDPNKVEDLTKIIDTIDSNSKIVSEFTGIAKNILAKDPKALDHPLVEQIVKENLGESMYDRIKKIYNELIGT
jgi:hypothetical protein